MVAWALTALAGLYVALVWAATRAAGPRNWGLHPAAFLSPSLEYALLLAMTAAVVALAVAASGRVGPRPAKRPKPHAKSHRKQAPPRAARRSARVPLWLLALPLYGALLHLLRTRTHFLGDGGVWLNMLLGGTIDPFSEPLSAAVWRLYRAAVRTAGFPVADATFAFLPVLCGVAFAGLAWLFLGEALPRASRGARVLAWGLLITTGITQLYYGYIESYPIASVAVLAYLCLALRHARGADPPWLLPVALAVTVGFHLVAVVLYPSYAVAVLKRPGTGPWKAVLLPAPIVLIPLLLTAGGMQPAQWLRPFQTVARTAAGNAVTLTRPYPLVSVAHAIDIVNALLLAAPVPLLLGLAWVVERRGRIRPSEPGSQVLAAAALAALLALLVMVLPVAPAQDWDLTALLVLPAALAALVAGHALIARPGRGGPLLALSAASLLAFVLVNATEAGSIARYKTLLAPDAPLSAYGRGYGHSMLSEFYEDRGMLDSALVYADLALQSEPTNPRYWLREGTILYGQKRYDEAIPKLEEALRRGTGRVAAHFNLGLAYARTHRYGDAANQFRTAMTMDGTNPEYPHHLALMLYDSGYPDSARVMWEGVIERWPTYSLSARALERRFPARTP
jgi:tetratricopeptide (TPR) repeat protein